jgi:hypothetical protein
MSSLHEDLSKFMIISHRIFLRLSNVVDKSCRENQNTHFVLNEFFSENCANYEIMWKKYDGARQATDDNIVNYT